MDKALSVEITTAGKRIMLTAGPNQMSLRGKAVQLVLALLTTDYPRYLSRDELHRLNSWKGMAAASVGKQAARIIDSINRTLSPIIEWELKTQAWRLRESYAGQVTAPIKAEARQLLSRQSWPSILRFSTVPPPAIANWMRLCGSALVEMTQGNAEAGYRKLRLASDLSDHEGIAAISDVLATRLGQALPRPHLPVPGIPRSSIFFEAAESRRIAAYARTSPSEEWPYQFDLLHRRLLQMIEAGDVSTQAILFNALAILARRLGYMAEALDCIREAAALSLLSGDIVMIQNVSFNFGNILSGAARADPAFCSSETYLGLLELDMEIRQRLNVGRDSAQAELLYAYLKFENGDLVAVDEKLAHAEEIIDVSQQPYDIALFQRIKGLLLCDSNPAGTKPHRDGITALRQSAQLYRSFGNITAADEVIRDLMARETTD